MALAKNEFYSLKLKKRVTVPLNSIKYVVKNGRHFAKATYGTGKTQHEVWKVISKPKK